jgi:hypothetical protein
MQLRRYTAYFFGGVFLANAIPHHVCGLMARRFGRFNGGNSPDAA